jgi:hypothetical protein
VRPRAKIVAMGQMKVAAMIMAAGVAMVRHPGKNLVQALARARMKGIVRAPVLLGPARRNLARRGLDQALPDPAARLHVVGSRLPNRAHQSLVALGHQAAANPLKASQKGVRDPAYPCRR